MKDSRLARWKDSPLLLFCLLVAAAFLAGTWQRAQAKLSPPAVPGYDWAQHPRALLIAYPPDDCACGNSPVEWAQAGLAHGMDVVVLTTPSRRKSVREEVQRLQRIESPRLHIVSNFDASRLRQMAPARSSRVTYIENGWIAGSAQGDVSRADFLAKKT
jgi:hypothetical protein